MDRILSRQEKAPAIDAQKIGYRKGELKVEDVYSIKGVGLVMVSRILSGVLTVGTVIRSSGFKGRVLAIESKGESVSSAIEGQTVGVMPEGLQEGSVQPGTMFTF